MEVRGERIIVAKNISYKYPDGTEAVRDISIEIYEGEKVAILGPNGCGKSTLILLLSGLLTPTKGEILIFGRKVGKENAEFLRRNIGVVFQNPDDFLFNPTVREELLYTPAQLGMDYETAINLAKEFARKFEIEDLFEKPPFRLSGGEKKKVSIACSLMLNPKILFLDEPTANVDGKTRRKILELVQVSRGTIITATHEIDIVPKIAERVVIIGDNKKIIADGGLDILEDESVLVSAGVI
jgi:cobalt/nickel transport system ATP-binding protein